MKINKIIGITTISIFVMTASVFGGQIVLNNGDRLTGTVTQMTGGTVTIETELAGTLEIPAENISTVTTDEPVELVYADGSTSSKTLTAATPLTSLTAINPPKPEKPRWKGDISGGLAVTTGNTSNESYNVSANLFKRTEKDRITLKTDTSNKKERTSGSSTKVTTEDWWKTSAKYDYFLSKKWYAFGEARYETDSIALLDSRTLFGGGSGYQWIESDNMNFATELGLSCMQEDYSTGSSDSNLSARAGYHFDTAINSTFSFIHDLTYFASTEELSDYYLTSSAELRAKLVNNWFANAKVLFDFDTSPASGKGSTDVKYLLGAGVSF